MLVCIGVGCCCYILIDLAIGISGDIGDSGGGGSGGCSGLFDNKTLLMSTATKTIGLGLISYWWCCELVQFDCCDICCCCCCACVFCLSMLILLLVALLVLLHLILLVLYCLVVIVAVAAIFRILFFFFFCTVHKSLFDLYIGILFPPLLFRLLLRLHSLFPALLGLILAMSLSVSCSSLSLWPLSSSLSGSCGCRWNDTGWLMGTLLAVHYILIIFMAGMIADGAMSIAIVGSFHVTLPLYILLRAAQ